MRTLFRPPCVFCLVSDLPKRVACELFFIIFFGLYPFQNRTYFLVARWSLIADAVFFFFIRVRSQILHLGYIRFM
jgi:hypothetical protein